ncbi:MAG: DUF362 domain-containing protein [Deltaproteobacteria bacterium]|nr:DUF362 domain-containing protein [Deltaproteobacteria bacterium]
MDKHLVAVGKYEKPLESVRNVIDLCGGMERFKPGNKVFIKPNIVFWSTVVEFPKYGVITTSRIIHDVVAILKENGVDDITIGEGSVTPDPRDSSAQSAHAYESLGYNELIKRYGIKTMNVFDRPFKKVDLGDEIELKFNQDVFDADLIVDLPVMKTHSQTAVSLGIKNLKGLIDIPSRRACHNADPERNLHFWVSHLADKMPPIFTLIDGIYTAEYGPSFDGRMHRSNLLVASNNIYAADKVGALLLGHEPQDVPHLAHYGMRHSRPLDLSDVKIVGEAIEDHAKFHESFFPYTDDDEMPAAWDRRGYRGISYRKYDLTMCTYCANINGAVISAIMDAWKGEPWDDVEVLTGKRMLADPKKKHTILLGKCMVKANKDNPNIQHMIPVKSCPPKKDQIIKAFHEAGIAINPDIINNSEMLPGHFMRFYKDRPEFEPEHFKIE